MSRNLSIFDRITDCAFPVIWETTVAVEYKTIRRSIVTTTHRSNIAHQATFNIFQGNAVGRFLLPLLGVVWTPNADLSGWVGMFQVENVCAQGTITIPWQYPDIDPPSDPPTDPGQRIFLVYANVILEIAIGTCPSFWEASSVDVYSDFGYNALFPYSISGSGINETFDLGDQFPNSAEGQKYAVTYDFNWSRTTFSYATGEGSQRYTGLTATLIGAGVGLHLMIFTRNI